VTFRNKLIFLWQGVVSSTPKLQAGGPPLVGYLQLLIQYIHNYLVSGDSLLHPQPEDVQSHGDKRPT
jgi:hypothetical protein